MAEKTAIHMYLTDHELDILEISIDNEKRRNLDEIDNCLTRSMDFPKGYDRSLGIDYVYRAGTHRTLHAILSDIHDQLKAEVAARRER